MPWDEKTERRKNAIDSLTTMEEIMVLHNQFTVIQERITSHKKAQDEGFAKLELGIQKISDLLIPSNGNAGILEQIRELKQERETQRKQHDNMMKIAIGSITALIISIAAWIGKAVLFLLKTMGGN